jgi:hypothetical protein
MRPADEAVLISDLGNPAMVPRVGQDRPNAIEPAPPDQSGDAAQRLARDVESGARQSQRLADRLGREIGRRQMAIDVSADDG